MTEYFGIIICTYKTLDLGPIYQISIISPRLDVQVVVACQFIHTFKIRKKVVQYRKKCTQLLSNMLKVLYIFSQTKEKSNNV